MSCKQRRNDCAGPYTVLACNSCRTQEVEGCESNARKESCKGPMHEPGRCSYCTRLASDKARLFNKTELDRQRIDADRWRADLNLPSSGKIFDGLSCSYTTAGIDQYTQIKGGDYCPWVRVGNLYVTVTTGNDQGWVDLIHSICAGGNTNADGNRKGVSVFTGRHGTTQGTIIQASDSGLFHDSLKDPRHVAEDIIKREHLRKELMPNKTGPKVTIWDVGTTAGTSMKRTKRLSMERMRCGDIVIWAWCWSLLSPYKAVHGSSDASYPVWEQGRPYNRPISEIVTESYGWALRTEWTPGRQRPADVSWRQNVDARSSAIKDVKRLVQGKKNEPPVVKYELS
ncbi:hypothetical protein SAMN05518671_1973 [Stenotrophomonas lactitubi]|nr:hypothetical protein SAMN04487863_2505 [Stenotrophomonas sp. yr243]SNS79042.1 hypothetical protein SAMN05518671_1973 [Stenotrophomonas lactitubi]